MNKLVKNSPMRAVIWPFEVDEALGSSQMTRLRYERAGFLPPRDFWLGTRSGWKVTSLPEIATHVLNSQAADK
jgi:hypothetical protein